MPIEFSKHALERMKQRGIPEKQVRMVVSNPDSIVKADHRTIFQSLIESESGKTYLFRVFLNTEKDPNVVITVYKTSKLEKYL